MTWTKCCFTDCSILPRTHFWKRNWQKPLPGSHHLPIRKKGVISLLQGTFKDKNKALTFLPSPLKPSVLLVTQNIYRFCLYRLFLHDYVKRSGPNYHCSLFIFTNHHFSLTGFQFPDLLSFLSFPTVSFSFRRCCWDFIFILLVTVCTCKAGSGQRKSRKSDNSPF